MKKSHLFNAKLFLSQIDGNKLSMRYGAKTPIFHQGEACDSIYYIEKGQVKLTVVSKRGKVAVVGILGAGDFLGEECLAAQQHRSCTATTLAECALVCIEKSAALKALRADPAFSQLLLSYLLERNIRTQEDLMDQLFNSSEKRLARILLLLANYGKEAQPDLVVKKISQETLAEMVGTTRSRINYFMNKFRKLGFIKYNGSLEVNSAKLNEILYD